MINQIHGGNVAGLGLVDFSVNINPLGPPLKVKKTITKNLDRLVQYPQPDSKHLKNAIAFLHNIHPDNLLIGNGSIELIYLIPQALKPKKVLIPVPTFSEYEFASKAAGAMALFVRSKEDEGFRIDTARLAGLIPEVDLFFLCNPNNPTSTCLSRNEILYLLRLCMKYKAMLVIDETFIDFVKDGYELSFVTEATRNKFLLVLRSLTKFFAIPGLRLGYLVGHRDLIGRISEFQYPWNVNVLAQIVGEKIINDKVYIKKSKAFILREKEYLYSNLKNISGLKVYLPSANFILSKLHNARIKDVKKLSQRLIDRGIVIRNCDNFRGLDGRFFRVAVKKRSQNNRLLKSIRNILAAFAVFFMLSGNSYAGYSRIVSLAPSITAQLYELKSQDKIAGVTLYCKADGKEIIGTLLEPNIEKVVSLKPDLILAIEEWNSQAVIDRLKNMGLNVSVFHQPNSFKDIADNFIKLAKLLDKQELAENIISSIDSEINQIFSKVKGLPKKKVFWQMGERPLVTISDNTFNADFLRFSGGINLFSDLKIAYPVVSYEEVIRRNPEIIIIVTMGYMTENQRQYWLGIKELDAAKNKSVFIIDADKVCQPTPLRFLEGLKEVAKLIHPEIFK